MRSGKRGSPADVPPSSDPRLRGGGRRSPGSSSGASRCECPGCGPASPGPGFRKCPEARGESPPCRHDAPTLAFWPSDPRVRERCLRHRQNRRPERERQSREDVPPWTPGGEGGRERGPLCLGGCPETTEGKPCGCRRRRVSGGGVEEVDGVAGTGSSAVSCGGISLGSVLAGDSSRPHRRSWGVCEHCRRSGPPGWLGGWAWSAGWSSRSLETWGFQTGRACEGCLEIGASVPNFLECPAKYWNMLCPGREASQRWSDWKCTR